MEMPFGLRGKHGWADCQQAGRVAWANASQGGSRQVEVSLSSRLLGTRCSGGVQNLLRLSVAIWQGSMICAERGAGTSSLQSWRGHACEQTIEQIELAHSAPVPL